MHIIFESRIRLRCCADILLLQIGNTHALFSSISGITPYASSKNFTL